MISVRIDGVVDGLAHQLVLERLVVRVESDHAGEQLGHLDHVLGDLGIRLVHGILGRPDDGRVQLLGPEGHIARGPLGHDLVHDLVEVGLPLLVVVGVLGQNDLAALDPLHELEGAQAHRIGAERVALLLHLLAGKDGRAGLVQGVGWIDGPVHGDLEREIVDLAQPGDPGGLAFLVLLGALDHAHEPGRGRGDLRIHDPLVAPDHVIRGHPPPVVELHVLLQRDLVHEAVRRDLDLVPQLQLRPVVLVVPTVQAAVDVHGDDPVIGIGRAMRIEREDVPAVGDDEGECPARPRRPAHACQGAEDEESCYHCYLHLFHREHPPLKRSCDL